VTLLDHDTAAGAVPNEDAPRTREPAPAAAPDRRADAGDLSSYVRDGTRSLRGALVGAVVGLIAAAALLAGTPSYTGQSTVSINPLGADRYSSGQAASDLIDPPTEIAIAQSDAVLRLAVDKYGPLDVKAADLRDAVQVTAIDASTVLQVQVSASSAAEAQREADAVARAYLYYRADMASPNQDETVATLEAKIKAADAARMAAGARFKAAPPHSQERVAALADHTAALDQRNRLQEKLASVQDLESVGGTVLRSASSVPATRSPSTKLVVVSCVAGGAVIGFVLAFLLLHLGSRLRRPEDLERVPGLSFSAVVRKPRRGRHDESAEVFRAAREQRKIDGWPEAPYSTVFALDLRSSPALATPLGFAEALAQEHGSATLMALGWESEHQEGELEELGLRKVADHHYVTTSAPKVNLRTFLRDDSASVTDAYLTNDASSVLDSLNASPSPIVVWCAGTCGEATRLAVLARSDTLLVALDPKHTRIAELRGLTGEASAAGVAWVGALFVR